MSRGELIARLADLVEAVNVPHPRRVAVDGPDAAGKTVLADELATVLRDRGHPVIRASVDGFHRPREERYRRGAESPVGYYEDSFDNAAIVGNVLAPLGPGGTRRYRTALFDSRDDVPVECALLRASDRDVLVFDGVFLLRPELRDRWDFSVLVSAGFDVTLERARKRDLPLFGSEDEIDRRYRTRYIPGQQLYFEAADPERHADVVVVNDDPTRPELRVQGNDRQRGARPGRMRQERSIEYHSDAGS